MQRLSIQGRLTLLVVFVSWICLTLFIVLKESRFPGTDVFLFKEAGVNLANKGELVAANLNYMPLDQEMPFAIYPPLYPATFGFWSKLVGVGIKQSLLFECLLRGIRALILGMMLWAGIKSKLNSRKEWLWGAGYLAFLFLLTQISTDDDRPDELGLIFGLLSFWCLRIATTNWGLIGAGLLIGVAAAASPACGICFGFVCAVFLMTKGRRVSGLGSLAIGSILGFASVVLPHILSNPEVIHRFLVSADRSSNLHCIPYLMNKCSWPDFFEYVQYYFNKYFLAGSKYLFCAVTLSISALSVRKYWCQTAFTPFVYAFVLFVPLAIFTWALQPYYLWFASIPLAFMLGQLALEVEKVSVRRGVSLAVVIAFAPLSYQEAKGYFFALNRPDAESINSIRSQLLEQIPPEERVAISADQFFTLRNYREVADINFVCQRLSHYDFVYATRLSNSRKGLDMKVPIPCWSAKQVSCFEPIENLAHPVPITVAGMETNYLSRGNGGTLYKNVHCPREIVASRKHYHNPSRRK